MTENQTTRMPYVIEPEILQRMGPRAAVVYAILMANDCGDGARITHGQMAKAAGISRIAARRLIDKLRDAGLVKSEHQFQHNRQEANLYQVVTTARAAHVEHPPDHSEQAPAHDEQPKHIANTSYKEISLDVDSSEEEKIDEELPGKPGEGLRPSEVDNPTQDHPPGEPGAREENPTWPQWPEPGSSFPALSNESGQHKRLFDIYRQAEWVVIYTEGYVLARMNQERQARGWKTKDSVGEDRRNRWLVSAVTLLSSHPLPEVVEVIDWLFTRCNGYIPICVVDDERPFKQDRKVTNLRQVLNHYPDLKSEMATGKMSQPPPPKAVADQDRRSRISSIVPLTDEEKESQTADLVSAFTDFRASSGDRHITDFRTTGWAKTFRMMLGRYRFEDIKAVIVALRDCPGYVDQQRYFDAFDMNRPGEWANLIATVEAHRAAQNAAKTAPRPTATRSPEPQMPWESSSPERRWVSEDNHGNDTPLGWFDEDDDKPRRTEDASFGSLNTADNIEQRRAQYAARAAQNRGMA